MHVASPLALAGKSGQHLFTIALDGVSHCRFLRGRIEVVNLAALELAFDLARPIDGVRLGLERLAQLALPKAPDLRAPLVLATFFKGDHWGTFSDSLSQE